MSEEGGLPFADLEVVYDRLAEAIDAAGPERESLFLAKLALLLSRRLGERAAVEEAIAVALADLDNAPPPAVAKPPRSD